MKQPTQPEWLHSQMSQYDRINCKRANRKQGNVTEDREGIYVGAGTSCYASG